MVQTVKERLVLFLKAERISQTDFSSRCGLSRGYVNNLKDEIYPSTLRKISKAFPYLSIDWLTLGYGSMYRQDSGKEDKSDISRFYELLDRQQQKIDELDRKIDRLLEGGGR